MANRSRSVGGTVTFDLLLLYYDNPATLAVWLHRLFEHSDFLDHDGQVIVCDTGTPQERIPETVKVLQQYPIRTAYLHVDTSSLREACDKELLCRPAAVTYNTALKHVCQSELLIHSVLGIVFTPTYFADILAVHETNQCLYLQFQSLRSKAPDYYVDGYKKPLPDALGEEPVWLTAYGFPDWSCRRDHLVAVGGWDEDFIAWGVADVDLCCRLTGKAEAGVAANLYFCDQPDAPPYPNYGLEFRMPDNPAKFSLVATGYDGYLPEDDPRRQASNDHNRRILYQKWGIMKRRSPTKLPYQIIL